MTKCEITGVTLGLWITVFFGFNEGLAFSVGCWTTYLIGRLITDRKGCLK